MRTRILHVLMQAILVVLWLYPASGLAVEGDRATHESDHEEDAIDIPEIHVHGLPLNKDQQRGPVPTYTPWPKIPFFGWARLR
jgi:hypothetical protein